MGLFNRTLSERYSKLVKLIKSIDSHFQLTEDKEDSVRLHLPNYKGNQTMDFHIYLLEPFLYISFTTELEGEKISCLRNYHQNIDQQDMFNDAMARNLNKVHEVLGKKYSEDMKDEEEQTEETAVPNSNEEDISDEGYGLNYFFDFDESYKKHILTIMALRPGSEFHYYSSQAYSPLWKYNDKLLGCQASDHIGGSAFAWMMQHYEEKEDFCYLLDFLGVDCMGKEYLDLFGATMFKKPEELISDIKRNIPSFKLGNDPQKVQPIIHQTWMDLIAINNFIDYCSKSLDNLKNRNQRAKQLRECSSIEDLALLFLSEYNIEIECHSEKTEENIEALRIVNVWSLLEFAKAHGKMQVGEFCDKETGKVFKSCVFTQPDGTRTFVAFSTKLGELTPKQIVDMKNELQVVQLESGNYSLCKIGNSSWENVIFNATDKKTIESLSKVTDEDLANAWTDDFGVKYSLDKKRLLKATNNFSAKDYVVISRTNVICDEAFQWCDELSSIHLPNSVIEIGAMAFYECRELLEIVIPDSIRKIGSSAFDGCSLLVHIDIPNSVITIGDAVFDGCCSLKQIIIPESVKEIGNISFRECCELENVILPHSVSSIGYEAFYGCKSLKQISLPDSVTYIGERVFPGCDSLASIEIPNSVIHIGDGAFFGCKSLTSIYIPERVKEIGEDILSECSNLTSIIVDEHNTFYDSRDNCNAIIETKTNTLIAGCATTIIPKGVTKIAHQAFGGSGLKTVVLPDGLVEIEQAAFCACAELETIIIPESVAIIGALAFCGCDSLTSIKLPSSVENIEESAFWQCKHLSTIIIPHGSKEKFERLLPGYGDLLVEQSVDNEDLNGSFTDEHGVKYSSDMKILKRTPKEMSDYSIIDGTKTIGDASFSNCESLVSVTIPRSVNDIGHYAFAGCKKIFSIIIPCGVKSIGDGAFMNCETLKSLRLSEGLVSISDDAFDGCNNLNTIFVPVEEKNRFEAMLSKFNVNIAEYNNDNVSALDELLSGLLDGSGVLYSKDGKVVFTHTKKLCRYSIKEGTEFINDKAFSPIDGVDDDLLSLKEIFLPETIVTIGELAFANNEGLIEISLPASIKSIGKDAFLGCKSLSLVRIPHGTRAKFEKLLPGLAEKLHEKYGDTIDQLTDFELPNGSIYNGSCIRKPFGNFELNGIGSISYTNGDKYKGNFKYGRPYGWGIYWFKNGKHSHKGYFDDLPKGIGYLNEDYDMAVGNFYEGRLHGWAICYRNRIFKFGYWKNGKLLKDETNKTLWIRKQISHERAYYQGNLIQIDNKHEYIRFGVPPKIIGEKIPGIPESQLPKMTAWGFEFFKDGSVKVGAIRNHDSGEFTIYYPDGRSELGKWKEGVKTSSFTIDWLQKPVDEYEVDGLDVF